MFYLDTPLDVWLRRYPALKDDQPLCDCEAPGVVPFRTRKSVGIVCRVCNSGTWIRASDQDNLELYNLLYYGQTELVR